MPATPLTPDRLSHRHHRLALLAAQGRPSTEIAADTGYSQGRVSFLLNDPVVHALVEKYQQQFFERAAQSFTQDITLDAPKTFRRLQKIRDNPDDEIAVKGCVPLWDRQVPKKTIHEEDRTVRIVFAKEDRERCIRVLDEDRLIDVTSHAVREDQQTD